MFEKLILEDLVLLIFPFSAWFPSFCYSDHRYVAEFKSYTQLDNAQLLLFVFLLLLVCCFVLYKPKISSLDLT